MTRTALVALGLTAGSIPRALAQTAPAPVRATTSAPAPPPGQPPTLGRGDSIALEAAAPDGRWLAYCQPTQDSDGDGKLEVRSGPRGEMRGDAPSLFLMVGGDARPIDELHAYDDSGRWLVVSSEGKPWLVDADTGGMNDLSAYAPDLRADGEFLVAHRALSFDASGTRLLLLRRKDRARYEADLFDLSNGYTPEKRQTFKLLPGEVWRGRLSGEGPLAVFESVPESQREGDSWPAPPVKTKLRRCHGLATTVNAWNGRGGPVSRTVIDTRGSLPALAPGFVAPFGDGWLRRERNGRLLLVRGATQKQLASASCGPRIVHSDPGRQLLLVSCERFTLERPPKVDETKPAPRARTRVRQPAKNRYELYLVGPGYLKELEADTGFTGLDLEPGRTPRLVPLRPGPRSVLIDMDRRRLIELGADDRVIATHGAKALVRRGRKLSLYDADRDETTAVTSFVRDFPAILVNERYAFVEPYVVELPTGHIVGEYPGAPFALTNRGRLVVPSAAPSPEKWGLGPLRVIEPGTPPTAKPPAVATP